MKIGPMNFKVFMDNPETMAEEYNGMVRYNDQIIVLKDRLHPELTRQVLWHEIIHVILTQAKIEHDEKLVDVLAYGVFQVLQENGEMREKVE